VLATQAGGFDSDVFVDLEQRDEEREANINLALSSEEPLDTLSPEQLGALIEAGEKQRTVRRDDQRLSKRLANAYFQLGSRYQKENSLSKAFVNLSTAVELDGNEPEYLYARANIFARGEQFEAATSDIDRAIKLAPNRGELHWAKGVICLLAARTAVHQDQLNVAVEAFSAAIVIDPGIAKYYSSRGAAYSRLGNLQAAVQDLDAALKLDPKEGKAYYNRGCLKLQLNDMGGATADFRSAVACGHALANAELRRLTGEQERRH